MSPSPKEKAASDSIDRESSLARELLESGSDLAGATTGAAIGLLGGPGGAIEGAAAGVAVTRALKRVGAELKQRFLSPREQVRVGAAFAYAGAAIREALDRGQLPRSDGFFDEAADNRPKAEELLEGVLLKARDSYEEKKLLLLGNL